MKVIVPKVARTTTVLVVRFEKGEEEDFRIQVDTTKFSLASAIKYGITSGIGSVQVRYYGEKFLSGEHLLGNTLRGL